MNPALEKPTPETDDTLLGICDRGAPGSAIIDLCRKLERERDALRAEKQHYVEQGLIVPGAK